MRLSFLIAAAFFLTCCDTATNEHERQAPAKALLPAGIQKTIQKEFSGAKPYSLAVDSLLSIISSFGIKPDQILWGQSTCVDDITNTKNKQVHPEIKGPFTIGGLGGIPFTGITGISAFSHHVPEDGTALIFVAPHIGINEEGWGKILRHGQRHPSSCCGALVAALNDLQAGAIKTGIPAGDDYQEQVIAQLALAHRDQIVSSSEPLVALTKVVFSEALSRVARYVKYARERHFPYAVVVVGVIINTDYEFEDYLWIERIAVKDIKKDIWISGGFDLERFK
jgi:hypothetical protein